MQSNTYNELLAKLYHLSLALCLIIIGAYSPWILYGIVPLFVVVIYGAYRGSIKFYLQPLLYGWLLFYVLYAVSALIYWDSVLSPRRLEYKLPFFIFPIFFSFRPNFKIKLNIIIISLAFGVLLASLAGITKSVMLTIQEPVALSHFLASNICINHPTYYAAFTSVAISGILIGVKYYHCIPENLVTYLYVGFLVLMILVSLSLAAITFLSIAFVSIVLYLIIAKRKIRLAALTLIIFSLLTIAAMQNRFIRDDFRSSVISLTSYINNPKAFISNSNKNNHGDEVRLIMWTASLEELIKNPYGVGTTRSDAVLSEKLNNLGFFELGKKDSNGEIRYNPHNQYLQTGLELGVLPMLIMIAYQILLIYQGFKTNNYWLSVTVLLLAYNCLFESILQRQSGIVGFTFITCLLLLLSKQRESELS